MWDLGHSQAFKSLCYILDCPEKVGYTALLIPLSQSKSLNANNQIFKEITNFHFKLLTQKLPA
jgi:hypothetical protein